MTLPSIWAHPLGYCVGTAHQVAECHSYNWYSGALGDLSLITIAISAVFAAVTLYRKHVCHVERCHRPSWHTSDAHGGHPVCRTHHDHTGRLTAGGLDA